MTLPTSYDCAGCGHTRWIIPDNEASQPDEDGLCAGCRDDGARRDAETEAARLTRERDAALEALRELRNAATVAYKDGRVPALPFVSAGNTIHAIETGAIHNDQP